MNLRDHMISHPGQFTVAESHMPLTVDMLSDLLLCEEVTLYHVGQDAGGRSKFHMYVRDSIHIATLVEGLSLAEAPPGQDAKAKAAQRDVGLLQ
jgi:hypothetical protein